MGFHEIILARRREPELSAGLLLKFLILTSIILSLALTLKPRDVSAAVAPWSANAPVSVDVIHHISLRENLFAEGMMAYQSGDQQTAIWNWRQAAEQGHAYAQFNLGTAYAKGEGITVDMNQAIKWWHLAASQGNTHAQYNLGLVYSQGQGVEKNMTEALRWWHQAAIGGDAAAQFNLGVMITQGDGITQNLDQGVWWLQQSANQGFEYAVKALEILRNARP
jgi:TPR repeat protein